MRVRWVLVAASSALLTGAVGEAQAQGTAQIIGGFTRVEADASVNCPPQGAAGDGDADQRQQGPVDFEEEVAANATSADLDEDCGLHASSRARQRTLVSDAGDGLVIASSGSAAGTGTGEPASDGDFAVERFNGHSRVSIGFSVTGGPVEFSMSGSHSGLRQPGSFSEGIVAGPRPEDRAGLPQGFNVTGVLPPGDYSVSAGAQCVDVPAAANGTTACPEARYSFTLVVGEEAADADGDALPDPWEEDGVDVDGDGTVDLDLPAMGADPLHKDLFLEVDHMTGHPLMQSAVGIVTQAFADAPLPNPDGTTGIALHVDNGPNSTMNPRTGETWGGRSDRDELPHVDVLGAYVTGTDYDWGDVDLLKGLNFAPEREPVFHYAISGHGYGSSTELSSGLSRGIQASDLLVTLGAGCELGGADCTNGEPEQAGTLMHEFGHNLGLRHGGGDGDNYKPNYLSIMNYAFQFGGLRSTLDPPRFDYSRFSIPFDEGLIDETTGFGLAAGAPATRFFTVGFCPGPSRLAQASRRPDKAWSLTGAGDFDCDGLLSAPVGTDVNADGATTALAPFEDWSHLVYDGGLVGLGADPLPDRTVSDEGPATELKAARDALDSLVPTVPTATPTPDPTATPPAPAPAGGSALRPPPVLGGLRVRPGVFVASRRGRGRARVTYRLSEAGLVRFRVERLLDGRRRGGRCVAPRRAPRGRRCTRSEPVRGSFRHDGRAGANSLRFAGRIAGKALRPGRYALVATPSAADGRAGEPRRVRFWIAR